MTDKGIVTISDEEFSQSVKNLEDLYNTSRINQEKKLSKISKQLEVLEVTIRKLNNSSKKNVPKSSGLDKRISAMQDKLERVPQVLESNDEAVEDIIGKIINLETHKCGQVPSSSTSLILSSLKAGALEEVRVRDSRLNIVQDQHLD